MNSVKIKWTGKGDAPATVQGGGFSLKPYAVKSGQTEVDPRDLYTVLNRKEGDWEVANVSTKSAPKKDEPDNSGGGDITE